MALPAAGTHGRAACLESGCLRVGSMESKWSQAGRYLFLCTASTLAVVSGAGPRTKRSSTLQVEKSRVYTGPLEPRCQSVALVCCFSYDGSHTVVDCKGPASMDPSDPPAVGQIAYPMRVYDSFAPLSCNVHVLSSLSSSRRQGVPVSEPRQHAGYSFLAIVTLDIRSDGYRDPVCPIVHVRQSLPSLPRGRCI